MSKYYSRPCVQRTGLVGADPVTAATAATPPSSGQGQTNGANTLYIDQLVAGTVTANGTLQILAWEPKTAAWYVAQQISLQGGQNRDVVMPWASDYVYPIVTLFPTGATSVGSAVTQVHES